VELHQNLLQEVTYESVLKRERAALHRWPAGWLERQARQAGRLDEFAGLLESMRARWRAERSSGLVSTGWQRRIRSGSAACS